MQRSWLACPVSVGGVFGLVVLNLTVHLLASHLPFPRGAHLCERRWVCGADEVEEETGPTLKKHMAVQVEATVKVYLRIPRTVCPPLQHSSAKWGPSR